MLKIYLASLLPLKQAFLLYGILVHHLLFNRFSSTFV